MAGFANITAINMCRPFRCGRTTAMAAKAVIHDAHVTKDNPDQPAIRHMTNITLLSGDRMRRTLAGGDDAVMTARTNTLHFGMVHRYDWYPRCTVMTGFTHQRGVDVAVR